MTKDQIQAGGADAGDEDDKPLPEYIVDLQGAASHNRAIGSLIGSRRCYMDQQSDDDVPSPDADAQKYVNRIVTHCAETPDYLLPDTPLKEAIFRVMLAGGNKPINAEEISEFLSERWAMTAYPRDLSTEVIQKLLESGGSYCIARLVDPDEEEDDFIEETPKVVIEPEDSEEGEEDENEDEDEDENEE